MGFENLKMGKWKFISILFSAIGVQLIALSFFLSSCQFHQTAPDNASSVVTQPGKTETNRSLAPDYVWETLEYIEQHNKAPQDFVGGREFQNRERRLPLKDVQQQTIRYREWDVHPKISGQDRGPERLVTGSDQSAWYTRDHYNHFIKLK